MCYGLLCVLVFAFVFVVWVDLVACGLCLGCLLGVWVGCGDLVCCCGVVCVFTCLMCYSASLVFCG